MIFAELIVAALLVIAAVFGLVGSIGLLKLPDQMTRLHAPTKATTLGVGGVLLASMLYFLLIDGRLSFHELMITLFLFLAAPITAFFIARVHLRQSVKPGDLPKPKGKSQVWAGRQGFEQK
ncbi:MAG: Na+/H+ antiporter subunit G [Roseinatronobacter sp.]